MPNLYLTNQYYQAMPYQPPKVPRVRFVRYYDDLFDMEGIARPLKTAYMVEGQYDFSTLGDAVLKPAQESGVLSQLDLLIVAYWGHEFDPDGSFGAYFSHQYELHSSLFDVCDQGILSPVMALHLILAYAKLGKIKNAALLCFDQQGVPVEANYSGPLPAKSSARLLSFSTNKPEAASYQLLEAVVSCGEKINFQEGEEVKGISIDPGSPYYSSAELFSPLFKQSAGEKSSGKIRLNILDVESQSEGTLLFSRTNS